MLKIDEPTQGATGVGSRNAGIRNRSLIVEVSRTTRIVNAKSRPVHEIRRQLRMRNPKYDEAVRQGRWTGNMDETIDFSRLQPDGPCIIPRGFTRQALDILRQHGERPVVDDQRLVLPEIDIRFRGELRPYQERVHAAILRRDQGVANMPTGAGKTTTACSIIAARRQPTLVVVHSLELAHQWRDRLRTFLGVDAGLIGGGCMDVQPITVGVINSVRIQIGTLAGRFGHLVVDECHRAGAAMFNEVINAIPGKYRLGLSATPFRRDGLDKVIFFLLGDLAASVEPQELENNGSILRPQIVQHPTEWRYQYMEDYARMITAMTESQVRNQQIVCDAHTNLTSGTSLVVSDRVGHCRRLADKIRARGVECAVLTGADRPEHRKMIVELVQAGAVPVLLATTALVSEGFDCAGLDQLYLATPIKFRGRLIQVVGRILRPAPGKQAVVHDYVDVHVPILKNQSNKRWK
ncbi:MAG: DEAD/DEAH box helicase [Desulfovibrionales bacterium]|nr:MAG: DEAD/DEAH box helicase [Desulfovibrionales bacterium]